MLKKIALMIAIISNPLFAAEYHFCPPSELVKQNEESTKAWEDKALFWSIGYRGWPYANEIGFDQAFFYEKENKLECRYKWINPDEKGTYLWTSVLLNPDADAKVIIRGKNWVKINEGATKLMRCTSGRPETCAFEVKNTR